ncbi:MAG: 16S rRNA (cytidine(1402)-2'-O)-methyltransferase [Pseudomonadota bacterium]
MTEARPDWPQIAENFRHNPLAPGLYIVATPIGNLGDMTLRALHVLSTADCVLCEDKRVSTRLFSAYGLKATPQTYNDHNAATVRPQILGRLDKGDVIAIISDAGTPLVSDPGYKLVRMALDRGYRIYPVPGASALLAGLMGAGLATDRFTFAGFPPNRGPARRAFFEGLAARTETLIFFEAARRLGAMLADLVEVFGDREAAIGRELTKRYEEFRRAPLSELRAGLEAVPPKGECVLLVAGKPQEKEKSSVYDGLLHNALGKTSVRAAVDAVVLVTGARRREVYQRALEITGADEAHDET